MKITTGAENYEVLHSGTILTFRNEPITFHLTEDLKVVMCFENDKSEQEHHLSFHVRNNKELEIRFTNFNSSLGTANANPLPLAKVDGRQVYLNFRVLAGEDSKQISHTWYLREEVGNG